MTKMCQVSFLGIRRFLLYQKILKRLLSPRIPDMRSLYTDATNSKLAITFFH